MFGGGFGEVGSKGCLTRLESFYHLESTFYNLSGYLLP